MKYYVVNEQVDVADLAATCSIAIATGARLEYRMEQKFKYNSAPVIGPKRHDFALRLVAMSLTLGVFLIFIRANLMKFPWVHSVVALAPRALLAAYYDLAYVAVIGVAFLCFLRLARRNDRVQRILYAVFVTIGLFSLLFALINVKIVPILGTPLNYRWLYYSDFLDSQDVRNAIFAELSVRLVGIAVGCGLGLLAAAWIFHRGLTALMQRFSPYRLKLAGIAGVLAYLVLGGVLVARRPWGTAARPWDRARLENPVVAFASSVFTSRRPPSLLTMPTSVGFEDFAPSRPTSSYVPPIAQRGAGRIRNVVFFVLESVAAEYLEAYGARYPATPQLVKRSGQSAIFTNIYAHGAVTSVSLVSIMLSIYPWLSYKTLTVEHPEMQFPSLSSELARRGYRTAFFSSADLRYQRTSDFLSHREFNRVSDYRSLPCPGPVLHTSVNDPLLDAANDRCIVDAFSGWVRSAPSQPFCALLWTMMTHSPYFVAGAEVDFGVADPEFNRYLNALRHSDQIVGELLAALKSLHLEESTLLVVLADHGETFGQHGQRGHGDIYEPSLHVPLILVNPILFHGERFPVVGGLIDIAPTVLDILEVAPPAVWQGRSLFRSDRSGRVYFFWPWGDNHLFGFREKEFKMIDNATADRFEIYNLSRDPEETINLANKMPDKVVTARERIAAWLQYEDRMMRGLIGEGLR